MTLNVTPADGWKLVSLEADGWNPLFGKSFSINRNTTVRATFKKKVLETYKVTLITDDGGEVTITGADDLNRVPAGTELYIIATPSENKVLKSVTVNG